MNQREKILAAGVLAILALWAGNHFYGNFTKTLHARESDVQDAHIKLEDAQHKLREGHLAAKQLEAFEKRALPANFEKASSLYKAWLLAKAKDSGLAYSDITQIPTSGTSTAYRPIAFQLVGNGSLSSVVSMLYEFYRSPQLHQITRLQLTRPAGSPNFTVSLDVEALCMKGAVAVDKVPEGDSHRLKLATAEAYKKSLGERDLAAAYSPPRPPGPPRTPRNATPTPPKFDDSEFAMFSGAVSSEKGMQAWITVRTTGETLHLVAGDDINVGALQGKIVSVEPRELVYSAGDKKFRVALGESLRKGKEIGAKSASTKEKDEAPPES